METFGDNLIMYYNVVTDNSETKNKARHHRREIHCDKDTLPPFPQPNTRPLRKHCEVVNIQVCINLIYCCSCGEKLLRATVIRTNLDNAAACCRNINVFMQTVLWLKHCVRQRMV